MKTAYGFIIPRLDGEKIRTEFPYCLSLVKKGIAGFIIFGGELEQVRKYVRKLQDVSELPLIIAADLERGLGQQLQGGTFFPPAMALASAVRGGHRAGGRVMPAQGNRGLLRSSFRALAAEARYAGINTIFAPVLDMNTNPQNPIISVRAFGENEHTVSFFGCEMISAIQKTGIAACGKHFPGHGDTAVDSHISLPVVRHDMKHLKKYELKPFRKAMDAGVKMIMLGHLKVPAIDPSGIPVSVSAKAVRYIREEMGYRGILITDAMNMGGLGRYSENEASLMALRAGVDILLHPSSPEAVAAYLENSGEVMPDESRIRQFRSRLPNVPSGSRPPFEKHEEISDLLTRKAVRMEGDCRVKNNPFLIVLNDEEEEKGGPLIRKLESHFPDLKHMVIRSAYQSRRIIVPQDSCIIVAVFSDIRAWKGGASSWLKRRITALRPRADIFISFGSPYILDRAGNTVRIYAYWDAPSAQEAAADLLHECRT